MALINCPECERRISSEAENCPECGYPIAKKQSATAKKPEKVICPELQDKQKYELKDVSQLKTSTNGYCPKCNHPYIMKADALGVDYYVCEKCGERVLKSKFEKVANPIILSGTIMILILALSPFIIFGAIIIWLISLF